jgi:2'-5' RNA ligase
MKRIFIGLQFPRAICDELKNLRGGVISANWVAYENYHLTLRFLGECDNNLLDDVCLALSQIRTCSFALQLQGVKHFKKKGVVKSLWVGIVKNPSLTALKTEIDTMLQNINIKEERRAFYPHVTLAKLSNPRLSEVTFFEQMNNLYCSKKFPTNYLTIFESYSLKGGSTYQPLIKIPLRVSK